MSEPAIRLEGVTKRFPGVLALEDVSFDVAAGSCHALCGENGAGKSTLGKILAGIYPVDAGRVIDLRPRRWPSAARSRRWRPASRSCTRSSRSARTCPSRKTSASARCPARGPFLSRGEMRRRAGVMLAAIGAAIDVDRQVGELSTGQQQMLQIAAAVGRGARIIVFDEPTSSLSQHEAQKLYELIGRLRETGVTMIYVSHRMEEIFRLCDTITVLRDGRHVTTRPAARARRSGARRVDDRPSARGVLPGASPGRTG